MSNEDIEVQDEPRPTMLRVDILIREVTPEGVEVEDPRNLRCGEIVPFDGVRDYFDRIGRGMSTIFPAQGPQVFCLTGMSNKIATIKVVRELTGLGLKDAKDLVEKPFFTPVLVVHAQGNVQKVEHMLRETGASTKRFYYNDAVHGNLPVASPPK